MGEEDALRTVDCLRGRLLAERVASKNAKEEAQLMGNKVLSLLSLSLGFASIYCRFFIYLALFLAVKSDG